MPIRVNRYNTGAFVLIGAPSPIPIFRVPIVDGETITRGRAVFTSSGEATNTGTDMAIGFLGIAVSTVDNTDDGEYAEIIRPLSHLLWQVYSGDELLAVADRGLLVDLCTNCTIDPSDVSVSGFGFRIDEIDISTAALAAGEYGFAIGHFEEVGA